MIQGRSFAAALLLLASAAAFASASSAAENLAPLGLLPYNKGDLPLYCGGKDGKRDIADDGSSLAMMLRMEKLGLPLASDETAHAANETASTGTETASIVNELAPAANETTSAGNEPAPAGNETAPTVNEPAPDINETTLTGNETAPAPFEVRHPQIPEAVIDRLFTMSRFAGVAYCNSSRVLSWTCEYCQSKLVNDTRIIQYLDHAEIGSVGYISVNDRLKKIIVTYRGTMDIQGWVDDFTFLTMPFPWGEGPQRNARIHVGFHDAYIVLHDQITLTVGQLMTTHPDYTLASVGHSLGAAMATLSAMHMRISYPSNVRVTLDTFGSPRVGNAAFSQYFDDLFDDSAASTPETMQNALSFRVVSQNDPVPHVPPIDDDYVHVSREMWVLPGNRIMKACSLTNKEDPTCSNSIPYATSVIAHATYLNLIYILGC